MPVVPFSILASGSLDPFPDLQSVPPHRHLRLDFLTERLRSAISFGHITIAGLDIDGFGLGSGRSVDTAVPPLMLETYFARGYHSRDPLLLASKDADKVVTEEESYDLYLPPQGLRELNKTFGNQNLTVFPVRRGEVVYGCVLLSRVYPFTVDEIAYLSFIAQPLHTAMTAPLMKRFAAKQLNLSDGEIICLRYASRGLTSEEIAARSGYQSKTVDSYIKAATKKLNAANRVEAVAECVRRGLLD